MTFCGFFPADEPQYSVIVVVWYPKQGVYPSAGGISGSAFKDIADQLYAQAPSFRSRRQLIPDTTRIFYPATKDGNITDLGYLLDDLEIPYTVEYDEEENEYVVEGPRIEKMLGYTNLESEKGFTFFQNFLKDTGILKELEELGIQEGDTVRMYGLSFDYYK